MTEQEKTLVQIERDIFWGRWALAAVVAAVVVLYPIGYDLTTVTSGNRAYLESLAANQKELRAGQEELRAGQEEMREWLQTLAQKMEEEEARDLRPDPVFYELPG